MKFVYQIVPYGGPEAASYGQNCKQKDIYNYFSISKHGHIHLSKSFDQLRPRDSDYMICFVNVRVQFLRMSSNVELIFIIRGDNWQPFVSEESLVKEALSLREKFNKMQKAPRLISSRYREVSDTAEKRSFTLFLVLAICVTGALFVVIVGSTYVIKSKRLKNKKSALYKWHVLLKRLKILAKLEKANKAANTTRSFDWFDAKKKAKKSKKSLLIYNEKEKDKHFRIAGEKLDDINKQIVQQLVFT